MISTLLLCTSSQKSYLSPESVSVIGFDGFIEEYCININDETFLTGSNNLVSFEDLSIFVEDITLIRLDIMDIFTYGN